MEVLSELFMDLWKAYDTLDRERDLELLAVYGVGPRTVQLLWTYWNRPTIMAKARGYFGHPSKGYRGVTQGDPLPPTDSVLDSYEEQEF